MPVEIRIFRDHEELAARLADEICELVKESVLKNKLFNIALSGGTTPMYLFNKLGDSYSEKISWDHVHFFWGDERCVPPNDKESNYGMTKSALFDKIRLPAGNVHRIIGENNPDEEVLRYSGEIAARVESKNGLPGFNLILLGLGEDGHTASIFPGNNKSFNSKSICETAFHPVSNQLRITITGSVINNAEKVFFLVTGDNKARVVSSILKTPPANNYPADLVKPLSGNLTWYLDKSASSDIR
jgi:6-phosphogluconolactonase